MKITLFWPPIPQGSWNFKIYPSMGSAYLDAVLRQNHEISVVDANIVHGRTAEFYKDYNEAHNPSEKVLKVWNRILLKLIQITEKTEPEILGIGSWSYNMPFVAEFTRLFKARNPDIPIILGGINPTMIPNETLMILPYIDYLIRGEGEGIIVDLTNALSKNKKVNHISGLSFIRNGRIFHTPERRFIANLDELPLMDYENFVGFKDWHKESMEFVQIMTSRGCVGRCSFCSVYQMWKGQRFYSENYINKQINHLLELYNYKRDCVAFMDDNFVVNFTKTKKLIDSFKNRFPQFSWQIIDMRVEGMSKHFFDYIKEKKCEFVGFGIESIHSPSLKFLNKTINPTEYKKKVFKILDITEKLKIKTLLSSILGTPEETKKDMIVQANFFIEVFNKYKQANFDVAPLVIHPGTDLWYKYKEGKIRVYQRQIHSPKRFYEGMFADKWNHLLEFVPNAYRIFSRKMAKDEFENILFDLIKKHLNPLTRIIRKETEEREHKYYLPYH